ncbi:hypothetical protein LQ318_10615 [Aliifodinibius salicampi]|uniref:Uncharacterized protein n=1 Tax=Fodinibius salicampi TaxID=1920655 RepID=A0ABT3PZV3_9BACT|nr:hypothetical protein [Fodinibius salicampi]MCW9713360.1 hypothetical protein [Fodinibius salicampi]
MTKEKYTFKDWKTGKIDKDFEEGRIPGIKTKGLGRLVDKVNKKGLIYEEEYQKIKDAQKDAFFKAVRITVDALIENFKKTLIDSPDPEKLLSLQTELLEEYLESAPKHYYKKVLKGEWDSSGIDYKIYDLIVNLPDEPVVIHIANPSEVPDENIEQRAQQFSVDLITEIIEPILPNAEKPENIRAFNLNEYVNNDFYHIAVYVRFLKRVKDLNPLINDKKKDETLEPNESYPNPKEVAKKFKKQSKNTKTPYTIKEYTFVMKHARDHRNEKTITDLISRIKNDPECPEKLKPKDKASRSIRNWIQFYDDAADILRNYNAPKDE